MNNLTPLFGLVPVSHLSLSLIGFTLKGLPSKIEIVRGLGLGYHLGSKWHGGAINGLRIGRAFKRII
jgi:hypothetical protein